MLTSRLPMRSFMALPRYGSTDDVETRARVEAELKRQGYVYHRGAANLRRNVSTSVALVITGVGFPRFLEECLTCHTVGYDKTATNGGFDDVAVLEERPAVARVGCNCSRPPCSGIAPGMQQLTQALVLHPGLGGTPEQVDAGTRGGLRQWFGPRRGNHAGGRRCGFLDRPAAQIGMETAGGQPTVEHAVEIAKHFRQFVLVLAEQQRLQCFRQIRIMEHAQEGTGKSRRADRIRRGRAAQCLREPLEAQIEQLQRALVATPDGFGQALPGEMEFKLILSNQAQRHPGQWKSGPTLQGVEVAGDQFAEAHDQTRPALAQCQHRQQVRALRRRRTELQLVLQLLFQRPVQTAGDRTQLLDGDALQLIEQANRIRPGSMRPAKSMNGHGDLAAAPRARGRRIATGLSIVAP